MCIRFPRTLPFSSSVPRLYKTIKEFYPEIMAFFHGIDLSNTQVDEFVCCLRMMVIAKTYISAR